MTFALTLHYQHLKRNPMTTNPAPRFHSWFTRMSMGTLLALAIYVLVDDWFVDAAAMVFPVSLLAAKVISVLSARVRGRQSVEPWRWRPLLLALLLYGVLLAIRFHDLDNINQRQQRVVAWACQAPAASASASVDGMRLNMTRRTGGQLHYGWTSVRVNFIREHALTLRFSTTEGMLLDHQEISCP